MHSLAIRTEVVEAGRPRSIDPLEVFLQGVEYIAISEDGQQKWVPSMRRLAKMFQVSEATIRRLPTMQSPWGMSWLDVIKSGKPHDYQANKRGAIWWAYFPWDTIRSMEKSNAKSILG